MKTTAGKVIGVTLLVALVSAASAYAQGSGQGQQNPPPSNPPAQQGQPTPPAKPSLSMDSAPPPVNAEEEAAYKTIFELKGTDFQHQIQLSEEFLKKFPESRYRESVYSRLTMAYLSAGEVDKMLAAGEKALELKSDDVDVLALMALVMPRRVNPSALDGNQKLTRAEQYAKQSIEILAALPKPANLSDAEFAKAKNEKLSMCHSGLGFVYYHRQKYADAANEFEQATKLASNPDPVDFFVRGLSFNEAKRPADAAAAFGHCSEIPGPMQARCKQNQDDAKKRASTQLTPPKP
jgi:tetratricopeptide (TPR) repeat protein